MPPADRRWDDETDGPDHTPVDGPDDVGRLMTELHETAAAVRARGEAVAHAAGQSQARWQALFTLARGTMTVPDLARRLGLTRQSVQRVVHLLVADGLVRGVPNPCHRRSALFELTADGRRTLDRINSAASGWHGAVRRALTGEERRQLRQALATVRDLALGPEVQDRDGDDEPTTVARAAGAPAGRRLAGAHR